MNVPRFKALRKSKGLSQKELGAALGVSTSAIGMYEQGLRNPDHKLLNDICKFFNVSVDYLIDQDTTDNIEKILNSIKSALLSREPMVFDTNPIEKEDIERIVSAITDSVDFLIKEKQKDLGK